MNKGKNIIYYLYSDNSSMKQKNHLKYCLKKCL